MSDNANSYLDSNKYPLALVTGAAKRLGKHFALTLARKGYAIALHYHQSREEALSTAEEIRAIGVPVFPLQADLTDKPELLSMFSSLEKLVNRSNDIPFSLKILVNSAAIMMPGDLKNMPLENFDQAIALNLRAPLLCAQLANQLMDRGGLIVNISDIAAEKTWTGYPSYTVSKTGLNSLTRLLARAFAPKVRVNGIAPGLVLPPVEFPADKWAQLVNRLPSQRMAKLDELGSALEFLIKNEYITGQTIIVDGGYSLL